VYTPTMSLPWCLHGRRWSSFNEIDPTSCNKCHDPVAVHGRAAVDAALHVRPQPGRRRCGDDRPECQPAIDLKVNDPQNPHECATAQHAARESVHSGWLLQFAACLFQCGIPGRAAQLSEVLPGHTAARFRQVGDAPDVGHGNPPAVLPALRANFWSTGPNRAPCGACQGDVNVDMPTERITSTCGSSTTFNDNQCADHQVSLVYCCARRAHTSPTLGESCSVCHGLRRN